MVQFLFLGLMYTGRSRLECNIHRYLITAIILGGKFIDDAFPRLDLFADWGWLSLGTIWQLEQEFLVQIDFELFISKKEFKVYQNEFSACQNF